METGSRFADILEKDRGCYLVCLLITLSWQQKY